MSSKQSTSKTDARVAQKEAMVTRHKSAQMKRKLRDKNRSMKHLTDLLQSPSKETQTSVSKIVQTKTKSPKLKSLLKTVEKVQKLPEKVFRLSKMLRKKIALVRDEEYYPNKRKRNVEVKKVVLKPSHDLQMVGSITGSVKRKSGVPLKASSEMKKSKVSSPVYSRLSMAEAIRIVEEDLTDEDMMEILTCPSPVWWEDPPDEEYIEDAIFTQSPPQTIRDSPPNTLPDPDPKTHEVVPEVIEVDPPAAHNDNYVTDKPIKITNLDSKGDKFLKKRSKLEGLLGNIKHKSGKVYQSKKDIFNEDLIVICSNYRKESNYNNKVNKSNSDNEKSKSRQSESDSDEILFHDTSINEDELLRDLENLDIPIENQSRQSDIIVIDDDDDVFLDKTNGKRSKKEIRSDETNSSNNNKLKTPKVEATTLKTYVNEKINVLPKNMPFSQKHRVSKELSSPKSIDSMSSKTSASSSQGMDSISDTNVRFLLKNEVEEQRKNISGLAKAEEIKSNKDLNTVDSQNVSYGFEKPDKLKSSVDLNKGDCKNISHSLEKLEKLKPNKDLSLDFSNNITDNLEKATNKLQSSNDLSAGHNKNISDGLEKLDKLKTNNNLDAGHIKNNSDGLEKLDKLKTNNNLDAGHIKNISDGLEKLDKLKTNNNLDAGQIKNNSDGLEKLDKLKTNNNLDAGHIKNISDCLEKLDKLKTNNNLDAGHTKNISDGLEKLDKLKTKNTLDAGHIKNTDNIESNKKLSLGDNKNITDDLEKAKNLKSDKKFNDGNNKNVFSIEKPDHFQSSKVLNTTDAKKICDGFEKLPDSNSDKGLNTGDQNISSIEPLKKYKNTSQKSITVFKIVEESDNSETDNTNSNIVVTKANCIEDKEEKSALNINDYYKKCKKVYQKKSKKIEDRTDINKNLKQIENDATFIVCELCKPKTKQVSDDKNVKYCLKCSSIFDSIDCTYCIEKSKSEVHTCVPCKIRFCCEAFYYKHSMGHLDTELNSEQKI